jgi:hypothetical protein
MGEIYIGLDFSLNSPAICIYDASYKWVSHCTKVTTTKKEIRIQEEVASLNDVDMEFQGSLLRGADYSSNDNASILNYIRHADKILEMILSNLGKIDFTNTIFHFAFEGYSFNSFTRSDNIIDIVAATTLMKDRIISSGIFKNFTIDIVSPTTLKQFAGYGKFDKIDMFDVFTNQYPNIQSKWAAAIQVDHDKKVAKGKKSVFSLNYIDDTLRGQFHSYCLELEINRDVKKPKIPKPIDDMIDAYFVCCWLREKFMDKSFKARVL